MSIKKLHKKLFYQILFQMLFISEYVYLSHGGSVWFFSVLQFTVPAVL